MVDPLDNLFLRMIFHTEDIASGSEGSHWSRLVVVVASLHVVVQVSLKSKEKTKEVVSIHRALGMVIGRDRLHDG